MDKLCFISSLLGFAFVNMRKLEFINSTKIFSLSFELLSLLFYLIGFILGVKYIVKNNFKIFFKNIYALGGFFLGLLGLIYFIVSIYIGFSINSAIQNG